jgi:hypothetical protein
MKAEKDQKSIIKFLKGEVKMKKELISLALLALIILSVPIYCVNAADSIIASTNYTETVLDWPLIRVSESYRIYGISLVGIPEYEIHKDDFCSIVVEYTAGVSFTPLGDHTKYYEYGNFITDTGYSRTNYSVWLDPSWWKLWANTKNFTIGLAKYWSEGVALGLFHYYWPLGDNNLTIEVPLYF